MRASGVSYDDKVDHCATVADAASVVFGVQVDDDASTGVGAGGIYEEGVAYGEGVGGGGERVDPEGKTLLCGVSPSPTPTKIDERLGWNLDSRHLTLSDGERVSFQDSIDDGDGRDQPGQAAHPARPSVSTIKLTWMTKKRRKKKKGIKGRK